MGADIALEHSEQSENWAPAGSRCRISATQHRWTSVLVRVRRWVLHLGGMSTGHRSSLHRQHAPTPPAACALPTAAQLFHGPRGGLPTSHTKTKTTERPFLERPPF